MSPVSELYSNPQDRFHTSRGEFVEADEVVFYRARVRALFIIEPDATATRITDMIGRRYNGSQMVFPPENWLEIAADEKQKLQRESLMGRDVLLTAAQKAITAQGPMICPACHVDHSTTNSHCTLIQRRRIEGTDKPIL